MREIVKTSDKMSHKYFGQPIYDIENYVTRVIENPEMVNDENNAILFNQTITKQIKIQTDERPRKSFRFDKTSTASGRTGNSETSSTSKSKSTS